MPITMPVKNDCRYIGTVNLDNVPNAAGYRGLAHPSFQIGWESLEAYNAWVNDVVLPIAFQWIEENKAQVYDGMPPEQQDDVGVVIAAAFERVKKLPAYLDGQVKRAELEARLRDGSRTVDQLNPVWNATAEEVHFQTERIFREHSYSPPDPAAVPEESKLQPA